MRTLLGHNPFLERSGSGVPSDYSRSATELLSVGVYGRRLNPGGGGSEVLSFGGQFPLSFDTRVDLDPMAIIR
jgi:hypothetical protein